MGLKAAQFSYAGPMEGRALEEFARGIPGRVGGVSRLGLVFANSRCVPHIEEVCDILRIHGRIVDVAGATGREFEAAHGESHAVHSAGFELLVLSAEGAEVLTATVESEHAEAPAGLCREGAALLALFDPHQFNIEPWLRELNEAAPGVLCVGGLASGARPNDTAVFLNGRVVPGGVVVSWRAPGVEAEAVVSQGCRPIGEPLTVTRAENNIVYSLGGQPAYHVLDRAFQTLSQEEKNRAPGNLFAGLATTEYVDEFLSGDFLIRHIIGADPASGAVVLAGTARIGQTLQYQFRDRASAKEDLRRVLEALAQRREGAPAAGVVFRCIARSADFFGVPGYDVSRFQEVLGPHPAIGLACNGEIGPLHGVASLTGYTAAALVFYNRE